MVLLASSHSAPGNGISLIAAAAAVASSPSSAAVAVVADAALPTRAAVTHGCVHFNRRWTDVRCDAMRSVHSVQLQLSNDASTHTLSESMFGIVIVTKSMFRPVR